jgi:ATP-dependent DNA helicase RecG
MHPLTATYEIDRRTVLVLWAHGGETRSYKARVAPHQHRAGTRRR